MTKRKKRNLGTATTAALALISVDDRGNLYYGWIFIRKFSFNARRNENSNSL